MRCMNVVVAAAFLVLQPRGHSETPLEKVAYIDDREVFILLPSSTSAKQLTYGGDVKLNLRWSPNGTKLAYVEKTPEEVARARLVVIDPGGTKLMETLIHPGGPSKVGGFRFIREVYWHGEDYVGLYGSVNPYTCEYLILEVRTGRLVADDIGQCRSFSVSPSGAQILSLDPVGGVPEAERRDAVQLNGSIIYPRTSAVGRPDVRVATRAVWSSDGTQIAFIETHSATGQMAIVVLGGKEWQSKRQALPQDQSDNIRIAWFGKDVVVASERIAVTYDPAVDRMRLATPEETTHVRAPDAAEVRAKALRDEAKAKAENRRWQEADVWRPEQ